MARAKTQPLSTIVGRLLRERREHLGLRLDDVADRMREWGADGWTRATVQGLEAGRRRLDLSDLWLVCVAYELSLVDLLRSGDPEARVMVGGSGHHRSLRFIRQAVDGEALFGSDEQEARGALLKKGIERARADARDETLRRVARSLGIDPMVAATRARFLWRRSLSRERDARVAALAEPDTPARSLQALRGHVTRTLVSELRADLQRMEGKWQPPS
jgi:transcriptional regulator with XRE-family HTH domain